MSNRELVLLIDTLCIKANLDEDNADDVILMDLVNEACDYLLFGE
jgi:hypothetical protein